MAGRLGRPKKPPAERRDVAFRIALSRKEYDEVRRAARDDGRTASNWARRLVLAELERRRAK